MDKELMEKIDSQKFIYRDKLNFDRKYKFGLEIEFENVSLRNAGYGLIKSKGLDMWDLKRETTVEQEIAGELYGGEITSPVLHNTKSTWKDLKKVCYLLKALGANCEEYSGAHIHVDQNILLNNEEFIMNFLKTWTIFEHIIYRFSYGELEKGRKYLCCYAYAMAPLLKRFIRSYNNYGNDSIYKDLMLYLDVEKKILKGGLWFADCKGVAGSKYNTIEVRCPNGTVNEVIWQNNVNFFIHLMKYASSLDFDSEYIDYRFERYEDKFGYDNIYLDDALKLGDLVFDDEIDKTYFLKQYVKNNK